MKYQVIYTGTCFDITAHFDELYAAQDFALMISEQGRMVKAIFDGKDVTKRYLVTIPLADVLKR